MLLDYFRLFDNFCTSESFTDFYASKFIYKLDNQPKKINYA